MFDQAVILAGGRGTRLMPLTKDIPKPLVVVGGQPFLHWQLRHLQENGICKVVLLVSHLADAIERHFTEQPFPNLKITLVREATPLGTGGALRNALFDLDERFWLLNGDSFLPLKFEAMRKDFERHPWHASMAVVNSGIVPVPGNVQLQQNLVTAYQRDAGFGHVDAGVYLLRKEIVLDGPQGIFDLGALWPPVIARQKLGAFACAEKFFDIGTLERLRFFEQNLNNYFT